MAEDINVKVTVDTGDAARRLEALEKAFGDLSDKIQQSGVDMKGINPSLNKVEKALNNVGKSAKSASKSTNDASKSAKGWAESMATVWARQHREAEKAEAAIKKVAAAQRAAQGVKQDKNQAAATGWNDQFNKLSNQADGRTQAKASREAAKAAQEEATAVARVESATRKRANAERELNRERKKRDKSGWEAEFAAINKTTAAQEKATRSTKSLGDSQSGIASQRYALYDVANAYGAIGTALAGAAIYAAVVGARFESAFTNVERTIDPMGRSSEAVSEAVDGIRNSLVQLTGQIPLTFSEISQIATLGNQMGIAEESIVDFTGTIARFSAVSGVSIDEVTKAFGGFAAQTGLDPKYFENLGASIALVGVRSNATEAQILSLMRELAASADLAGFSADEIVGLSGALASLQVAPERARGVMDTYFRSLTTAVSGGGEKLEAFSRITGRTAAEIDNMVRTGQGKDLFSDVITGLANTSTDVVELDRNLESVGLTGLRAGNTFNRFTNSLQVAADSFSDAKTGFIEGAQLQAQYAKTVDDLSSQWTIFVNGLNAVVDAITGGAVPGLAALFQMVNRVLFGFTEWLGDNQWARQILVITGVLVGMVGALFLVRSVSALARGTMLAFALMTRAAAIQGVGAAGTFRGMAGALFGVGTAASTASRGLRIFRAALISTGVGAAAVGLGLLLENLLPVPNAADDASLSLQEYENATNGLGGASEGAVPPVEDLGEALDGTGGSAQDTAKKIRTLVDYVNDLQGVFRRSSDIRFGSEAAMDTITDKWLKLNEQAMDYNKTIRTLTADRALKQYWLGIAEAYDDQLRAAQLREEIAQIDDKIGEAKVGASKSLVGNDQGAIQNRDTIRGLLGDYEDYILALAGAGATQDELKQAVADMNKDFLNQGKGLGFSEDELKKYMLRFEDLWKIIDAVPRDINVDFNTDPALQALNEFFAKANEVAKAGGQAAGGAFTDGLGGGGGLGGFPEDAFDNIFPKAPGPGVKKGIKTYWDALWEEIQNAFSSGDWSKVGAILAVGLAKAMTEFGNFWKDFGKGLETFGKEFAKGWEKIGEEWDNFWHDMNTSEWGNFWTDLNTGKMWKDYVADPIAKAMGNYRTAWEDFWDDLTGANKGLAKGKVFGESLGKGAKNAVRDSLKNQDPVKDWSGGLGGGPGGMTASGRTLGLRIATGVVVGASEKFKLHKGEVGRWINDQGAASSTRGRALGTSSGSSLIQGLRDKLATSKNDAGNWLRTLIPNGQSRGRGLGVDSAVALITGMRDRLKGNTSPFDSWKPSLESRGRAIGSSLGSLTGSNIYNSLKSNDPIFKWQGKEVKDASARGKGIGESLGKSVGSNVYSGLVGNDPVFRFQAKEVRDGNARGRAIGTQLGGSLGNATYDSLKRRDPVFGWQVGEVRDGWSRGRSIGDQIGRGINDGIGGRLKVIGISFKSDAGSVNFGGFAGGGYTGAGNWLAPAGVVHKGEYVVPKKHVNQSTGLPDAGFMQNLQRAKSAPRAPGYAGGGHVTGNSGFGRGPVELGPATLQYLAQAMHVSLNVDGRQLASTASRGDRRLAQAGSN